MNITKNKKIYIPAVIISIICLLFLLYIVFIKNQSSVLNIPGSVEKSTYNDLIPGKSTQTEVINKLGNPVNKTNNNNQTILEYTSNNPNFNNQIMVDSGIFEAAKQIVTSKDNISITDLNQKYGNYENVLYKSSSYDGFNLYIYPQKGVAYIGSQPSGIVLEIWYFKPMDFQTFKNTLGKGYPENPVEGQ